MTRRFFAFFRGIVLSSINNDSMNASLRVFSKFTLVFSASTACYYTYLEVRKASLGCVKHVTVRVLTFIEGVEARVHKKKKYIESVTLLLDY